jgi:hypothetical protein
MQTDGHLIPACLHFFRRYAQQLSSIYLSNVQTTSEESLQLLTSVLASRALTFLGLRVFTEDIVTLPSSLPLLRLHTVELESNSLIPNSKVEQLLSSCPILEDCTLKLPLLTIHILPVLGHHCPRLRRLWIESSSEGLFSKEAVKGTYADFSTCFLSLRILHID